MTSFRLAHFSDIHYTLAPWEAGLSSLAGKRLAGTLGYLSRGLRARFHDNRRRIELLLEDVDAIGADHVVCTGDVTSSMFDAELDGLARTLGPRIERPDRYTFIPGNHDRYVEEHTEPRAFERALGALVPRAFPAEKRVGGLRLVLLDPCRPTALTDSSGRLGDAQLEQARALLDADRETPTVVCLHYGLLRHTGRLDRPRHGLRDAGALIELLDATPARIALVLHGHMHRAFTVTTGRRTIMCAGSAIDLAADPGWFSYTIDLDSLAVKIARRRFDLLHRRFVEDDPTPFQRAIDERRAYRIPRLGR